MLSRFPEKVAGFAAAAALVAIVVDSLLHHRTGLLSTTALLPILFTALATAALAVLRLRLARAAAEEQREQAALQARGGDASLFASDENTQPFTAARSRDQFERWFVAAAPLLLALAQALWAWRLWKRLPWGLTTGAEPLLAASFLAAQAFLFFVLGRYLAALGRTAGFRMARGPAHAAGAACLASLVAAAAAMAAGLTENPAWEEWAARGLLGLAGLMAAENVLRFLLALYSPRRMEALAAAHESALGGLFIAPGAWARRLGDALDYQFGFAVSESAFARLMRNAIAPLLIAQLVLLHLLSCLVFLGPEEEGWRERLGRPLPGGQLASGFHLIAPWPFETVRRLPVRRVQTTQVGYVPDEGREKPKVLLWTIPHYKQEDNFLVPSRVGAGAAGGAVPVNLVTLNVPVEYLITNFFAHAYGFADPAAAVREAATRAVTHEVSGCELPKLLGAERAASVARIQAALQAECDRMGLGVRIVSIPLPGVHPPVTVADAFQSVVGALEQKEASILAAQAYAKSLQPTTSANADRLKAEADAYRARRSAVSEAEATQYRERLKAFQQSPDVFRSRLYLGSLRDALAGARKFIVDAPGCREVLYFNFEEKAFQNLFELAPEPGPAAGKEQP